jgi:epoxyqueuosine reductase
VRWLRNVAIAIGNALRAAPGLAQTEQQKLRQSAQLWAEHPDHVVQESIAWALAA